MKRLLFPARLIAIGAAIFLFSSVTAYADTLGDVHTFHVDASYDAAGALNVTATNQATGQNAYFYVDERYWSSLSNNQRNQFTLGLTQLASEFDSTIYPRSTALWGNEPRPGVDGDVRLTVLIENMVSGSGGYFKTVNEYPVSIASGSNAREMIYINAASVLSGSARDYLAHEFQHLISFNQKELLQGVSDDIWLNEARSEYNTSAVGYDDIFQGSSLQRREITFLNTPSDSLVEWPNVPTDYAIASMFTHYIADRFSPALLVDTIHSRYAGVVALDSAFASQGITEHITDIFTDWMIASYINESSLGTQYQYARPGLQSLHIIPQRVVVLSDSSPVTVRTATKEWQPVWLQFDLVANSQTAQAMILKLSGVGSWSGAAIGTYADGHHRILPLDSQNIASVPLNDNGSYLMSAVLAFTQGTLIPVGGRAIQALSVDVAASLGDMVTPVLQPSISGLQDGDLIRRIGQNEIYVIWGQYRRYLTSSTLALYGFQNRSVTPVSDDVFFSYKSSNYIRAIDQQKVYAVWPDGTKHWLNITPARWDASGRDWGAIFIVNDAEVNSYLAGADITQ